MRAQAWWFSHRADAHEDGLVKALGSDDGSSLKGAEAMWWSVMLSERSGEMT